MKNTWRLVTTRQKMEILSCVLGVLWSSALAAETPSWTFTTVDFPGFASVTSPAAVNNQGDIVGYYDDSAGAWHGYLRPNGGDFIPLDFPGAAATFAATINEEGEIVGTYAIHGYDYHGFARIEGQYITIDFPGPLRTETYNTNNNQAIVGGYVDQGQKTHGYIGIKNQGD